MTKRAVLSVEQVAAVRGMPKTVAAARLGVTVKHLGQRARQLRIKLRPDAEPYVPAVLRRRCGCGRVFECRDVKRQWVCPACEVELWGV